MENKLLRSNVSNEDKLNTERIILIVNIKKTNTQPKILNSPKLASQEISRDLKKTLSTKNMFPSFSIQKQLQV